MTEETVSYAEAAQAVNQMTRRVALLYLAFACTLVNEMGEEQGRALIQKAIWEYGTRIGQATRQRVEALGFDPSPENFNRGSDLSPLGFASRTVTVDGETRSQTFSCALADVWNEYGELELGNLYCQVDPAKMQAYNPSATMVHTRKLLWGNECCEIAVRKRED